MLVYPKRKSCQSPSGTFTPSGGSSPLFNTTMSSRLIKASGAILGAKLNFPRSIEFIESQLSIRGVDHKSKRLMAIGLSNTTRKYLALKPSFLSVTNCGLKAHILAPVLGLRSFSTTRRKFSPSSDTQREASPCRFGVSICRLLSVDGLSTSTCTQ